MPSPGDIRTHLFGEFQHRRVSAVLTAEAKGIVSGLQRARDLMKSLGLEFAASIEDAQGVGENQAIARVWGDPLRIARAVRRAVEAGCGLVVTTGGIGAEKKDQTLEALVRVDPQACLQPILKFRRGQGRHAKDEVRIGAGAPAGSRVICLPGPHDEVRLSWPVLKEGLGQGWSKEILAERLAAALRSKFQACGANHCQPCFAE